MLIEHMLKVHSLSFINGKRRDLHLSSPDNVRQTSSIFCFTSRVEMSLSVVFYRVGDHFRGWNLFASEEVESDHEVSQRATALKQQLYSTRLYLLLFVGRTHEFDE